MLIAGENAVLSYNFFVFSQNIFNVTYFLGLKCQEKDKCLWFSWFDLTYNDSSKAKTCFLKDKRPYGMQDSTGVISGGKGCNDIRGIVTVAKKMEKNPSK